MKSGYELEFYNAPLEMMALNEHMTLLTRYQPILKYDYDILKPEIGITMVDGRKENIKQFGGEYISPVYTDKKTELKELKKKLEILKKYDAVLKKNSDDTGFHIHMDHCFLGQDWEKYRYLLKFLYAFQHDIYQLAMGNDTRMRKNMVVYARALDKDMIDAIIKYPTFSYAHIRPFVQSKAHCIRFDSQTMEFRYFNSSLDYEVLKRDIDFVWNLCGLFDNNQYDKEMIDYYYGLSDKKREELKLQRSMEFYSICH